MFGFSIYEPYLRRLMTTSSLQTILNTLTNARSIKIQLGLQGSLLLHPPKTCFETGTPMRLRHIEVIRGPCHQSPHIVFGQDSVSEEEKKMGESGGYI
jgi:hypothetical protein